MNNKLNKAPVIKPLKWPSQDIFSSKDAALRKAMELAGMIKANSPHDEYEKYSEKWKPYRSTASIHLWASMH